MLRRGLEALGLPPAGLALAVPRLLAYHELLEEAVDLGFVGPAERDRLVPRHLLDSASVHPFLDGSRDLVDVGAGAGLPGLVLGCLEPELEILLVESDRRRAAFLERASAELGLPSVEVLAERAETVGRLDGYRETFAAATARALAPPPVALEYLLPLVSVGGRVVLMAGPSAIDAVKPTAKAAETLGGAPPRLERTEVTGMDRPGWVIIVEKIRPGPERYPRRTGVPSRRPLGGPRS